MDMRRSLRARRAVPARLPDTEPVGATVRVRVVVPRALLVLAALAPRVAAALFLAPVVLVVVLAPAFVFVVPVRAAASAPAGRRPRVAAVWLRPVCRPPRPALMGDMMSSSASIDVAVLPVRLPARGLLRDRAAAVLGLRIPVASSDVSLA